MEDDFESPSTCGFFSRRVKFNPKKTAAEELQAAEELVKKIELENFKALEVEKIVTPANKTRKKTTKKKVQSKLQDDRGENADDSFSEVILSSASKRRLKKLKDEQAAELERIEAENQKVMSAVDSDYSTETLEESEENFEEIAVLTIMCMSKFSRLRCYQNDKFSDIFPKVADLFDLKVTEFLLCLKTRNITVDDTPKSLKLTEQDILECIPYKNEENTEMEAKDSGNSFKIFFQSNDTKKKIDMLIHKVEKMQDIMKRYSEEREIPLEQLIFDFDGERLSGEETPADLDMEPESCVDVTVLVSTSELKVPTKCGRKRKS